MKRLLPHAIVVLTVLSSVVAAQTETITGYRSSNPAAEFRSGSLLALARARRLAGFSLMPRRFSVISRPPSNFMAAAAAANLQVLGSGTIGRLTKWSGLTTSNSFIGDSTIFEDKFGKVGIGTDTPTSRLTVVGLIESVGGGGGVKFPDGTVQTSSATGALFSVARDMTLAGNGTAGSPLGIAIPLQLNGVAGFAPLLIVRNTSPSGMGIWSYGAPGDFGAGGVGVVGYGGPNSSGIAGDGMNAFGGNGAGIGGYGLSAAGGSSSGFAGAGVKARGGNTNSGGAAGEGVNATGGDAIGTSRGGDGVIAI